MDTVDLREDVQGRARIQNVHAGELVSKLQNRDRQRRRRERTMRTLRHRSYEERAQPMDAPNYEICGSPAEWPGKIGLAGESQNDADELDRPFRRRRGDIQSHRTRW